jgi:hypothetical protein
MIKAENLLAIAWVVASEGAIFIRRSTSRTRSGEYVYYRACIAVANTDKEFMEKFHEMVDFQGYLSKPYRVDAAIRKPIYYWQITKKNDIKLFLQEILPYLPIKVAQAKAVVDFCDTGDIYWYEITKLLNKRGK